LREHLIAERIRLAVMDATGDYWKPFYYLLEDAGSEVLLVNARHVKACPAARPTSPVPPGWPSWARMGWSAGRLCRRSRSASCGI